MVPVDPMDDDLVRSLIDMRTAVVHLDMPGFPPPTPAQTRLGLQLTADSYKVERHAAVSGGQVVGSTTITMFVKDNQHLAEFDLEVHPDFRRQGIGTRLLAHVEERAKANGRDTLVTYAADEFFGSEHRTPGKQFGETRGYAMADTEICRRNDLSLVEDEELEKLYVEAWERAAGYELVEWISSVPDDIAEGIAGLSARMWTDPPIGELDIRPAVYDAERVRKEERSLADRGQLKLAAAVRHVATGEVAGFTEIKVVPGDEETAWQGDTIVDPSHRGNRLGTILKVANQRQLRRYRPRIRFVLTWNAEVNGHMIDINEAVGYRKFFRELVLQKKLD
ncbi:GNAT family N-acetyltransferase [Glycomyces albus]